MELQQKIKVLHGAFKTSDLICVVIRIPFLVCLVGRETGVSTLMVQFLVDVRT